MTQDAEIGAPGLRRRVFDAFQPLLFWFLGGAMLLTWDAYLRTTIRFRVSTDLGELQRTSATVDGERFFIGQRLQPGHRKLVVTATDVEPVERDLFLWLGEHDLGTIKLARSRGTLLVSARPQPATIEIRGPFLTNSSQIAGSAAVFDSIPVGRYNVTAFFAHSSEGWEADVVRNQTTRLNLEGKVGVLNVSTIPADADFSLTGGLRRDIQVKGKTPVVVNQLPPGQYMLEVARDDYRKSLRVDVTAGRTNDLKVAFEYAEVYVASDPEGATIYLNDRDVGLTPKTVTELRPGRYGLRFELKGFLPVATMINVKGNESLVVSTNLTSEVYASALENARRFGSSSPPDYSRALAHLDEALGIKPGDKTASELKERYQSAHIRAVQEREVAALAARRQAALDRFKKETDGELDSEMFDTFTWRFETTLGKAREALLRSLGREPVVWLLKDDSTLDDQSLLVTCVGKGPLGKFSQVKLLLAQVSPQEVVIHAKFWEYAVRKTQELLFMIKPSRERLLPYHPRYADGLSAAEEMKARRKHVGEDFQIRLVREL